MGAGLTAAKISPAPPVQSADQGLGSDVTKQLDWSANRRILGARQMRASLVVVAGVPGRDPMKATSEAKLPRTA